VFVTLREYVPSLCANLFSWNKALKKGFKVSHERILLSFTNKHVKLTFDRVINALDGCVDGVVMKSLHAEQANDGFAHAIVGNKSIYSINNVHRMFGHCGQETFKNTVKMYGFNSSTLLETCQECALPVHNRKA
jgi:hypothetical protein